MEGCNLVEELMPIEEIDSVPAEANLPTVHGDFRIRIFNDSSTNLDHVALTLGDMGGPDPTPVRIHSECLTGDAFGSLRCDCGPQLNAALSIINKIGYGCLVYLRQEGRGIGLLAKIQAYNLQDKGADTLDANLLLGHPADARDYSLAATILNAVGTNRINLMTNNPDKVEQLTSLGVEVVKRMPLIVGVNDENKEYLGTKASRMGHTISDDDLDGP
jgi:GTP cyclohydrolase II